MVFMVYTSDNNHGGTLFTDTPYNPNSYQHPHNRKTYDKKEKNRTNMPSNNTTPEKFHRFLDKL